MPRCSRANSHFATVGGSAGRSSTPLKFKDRTVVMLKPRVTPIEWRCVSMFFCECICDFGVAHDFVLQRQLQQLYFSRFSFAPTKLRYHRLCPPAFGILFGGKGPCSMLSLVTRTRAFGLQSRCETLKPFSILRYLVYFRHIAM